MIFALTFVAHPRARDDAANYHQTWPKDYSSTTCSDWSGRMNDTQRFAASGQLLSSDRKSVDGHPGVIPDTLVSSFEGRIDAACDLPVKSGTIDLAGVGTFLYGAHRGEYRP